MNILLIYPKFPDTFWGFKHALKFIKKRATLPPLGLITVAAMLPKEWTLRLVDMNVAELTTKDIDWADYAFISSMTIQRESVLQVIEICKKASLPIVAGGPLFTMEPNHVDFGLIAHLILGEAELSLPPFLEDFENGNAKRIYEPSGFPNIEDSPSPLWELLDLRKYASMSVQYSRGCPFNCEFCNITSLFGHKVRVKTAAQILIELNTLYKLGWRDRVFFVDDNLIGNKKRLKHELLPALIEWADNRRIVFNTQTSINLADDDELMKSLVKAKFDAVFIGIETPDEDSLSECGKGQNKNRDMIADIKRLQYVGLQVQGGFIVGFDNDTESIFQRQIDFIQKSGIVTAMVGLLQAPPGTRLYERLKRENRIKGIWDGDIKDKTNVIFLKHKLMIEGYERILRNIYSPKPYYQRVKTFLQEYNPPNIKHSIHVTDIIAGLKSFISLGIMNKGGRGDYWKFIFWALFEQPRLFPLAIRLSIYGYHYRETYKVMTIH